jgi:hypothetical protein
VWFFSSGPLDDSARDGSLAPVPQVTSLARDIEVRGHMTFGGLLDKKPTGLFGMFAWGPEGDFRDRPQVTEWVDRIAGELAADNASMVRVVRSAEPCGEPAAAEHIIAIPDEIVADDSGPPTDAAQPVPSRDRFGLRRYFRLDDEASDDDGLDLLMQAADQ